MNTCHEHLQLFDRCLMQLNRPAKSIDIKWTCQSGERHTYNTYAAVLQIMCICGFHHGITYCSFSRYIYYEDIWNYKDRNSEYNIIYYIAPPSSKQNTVRIDIRIYSLLSLKTNSDYYRRPAAWIKARLKTERIVDII